MDKAVSDSAEYGEDSPSATLLSPEETNVRKPESGLSRSSLIAILWASHLMWLLVLIGVVSSRTSQMPQTELHTTNFVSRTPIPLTKTQIEFDDLLQFNDTDFELWRQHAPDTPHYTGKPSLILDAAWDELLLGEFPAVSPEEIVLNSGVLEAFEERDRHPRTGNFHIGIEVFHSLHCLNAIRKELDYYQYGFATQDAKMWSKSSQRKHIDHCLNHIRQSLQCHPDLTPAAMKKHHTKDGDNIWIANAKKHSCYDWSVIRKWMTDRKTSGLGAWENNHH